MSEPTKSYTDQLWDMGKKFSEESSNAWERYTRMANNNPYSNPEQFRQRMSEFWQKETPDFMRRMMQLQMDYYMNVMQAGMEYNKAMLDSLFADQGCASDMKQEAATVNPNYPPPTQTPPSQTSTPQPAAQATDINLKGKAGTRLEQAFVMANREPNPVDVSFEISEFIAQDGTALDDVQVEFQPATFTLNSGDEVVVECKVSPDERFQTGTQYAAIARVVGFPNMMLRLITDVE
jgi:flagellar motor protein MotB